MFKLILKGFFHDCELIFTLFCFMFIDFLFVFFGFAFQFVGVRFWGFHFYDGVLKKFHLFMLIELNLCM